MDKMVCPNCEFESKPVEYKTADGKRSLWQCQEDGCNYATDPSDWSEPDNDTDEDGFEKDQDSEDLED